MGGFPENHDIIRPHKEVEGAFLTSDPKSAICSTSIGICDLRVSILFLLSDILAIIAPFGIDKLRSKNRSSVSEERWQLPQTTVESSFPSKRLEMELSEGTIGFGGGEGEEGVVLDSGEVEAELDVVEVGAEEEEEVFLDC